MTKRSWTSEEKEGFIKEAKIHKVTTILKKYKLSSSLFYSWKKRYETLGINGLGTDGSKRTEGSGPILLELIKEKEKTSLIEEQVKLYEELASKVPINEIPLLERAALVRKYNKRGLQLAILFDICRISKKHYYLELPKLKTYL